MKKKVFIAFIIIATGIWFYATREEAGYSYGSLVSKVDNNIVALTPEVSFELNKEKLSISHTEYKIPYLSILLDKAFLGAAEAVPEIGYKMAAFEVKETINRTCEDQTIEKIKAAENSVTVTGVLAGTDCQSDYTINFTFVKDTIQYNISFSNDRLNRAYFRYDSSADEGIFGFGEQFTHFNMKGHRFFMLTEEQGIGRGAQPITAGANLTAGAGGNEYTTYTPIPFYISSLNRSGFIKNSEYMKIDLRNDQDFSIEMWANNIRGEFNLGKNAKELLSVFTEKTGRFIPLPEFTLGTILGVQGGKERVMKILRETQKAGNPVTAIWIQDWVGRRKTSFGSQLWWRWQPDEKAYPDFRNWVAELKKEGIHTLGYINPFLADEGDMFKTAVENDYLVKDASGKDYKVQTAGFPAYMLDLINPKTKLWIKKIIKENMIAAGLSGWMADFGEWLPYDAVLKSGISADEYHNIYPVEWARLNREAIREAGKEGEIMFFTRAGFTESAKYSTLFWEGDQMVTFDEYDGLASAVTGLLSGGMSGIAFNHSDIGGYTTINNFLKDYHRSKNLFMRWAEANAFTLVYRTHEGNRPEENHQFYTDRETQNHFARMGKIHYALKPYFNKLMKQANETGLPVVQPLYLEYPGDTETYSLRHQFLTGNSLLVIPVIEEDETSVEGYFPEGKWQNIFTNEVVDGKGYKKVEAPLGQPAVFLKMNSPDYDSIKKMLKPVL